MNQWTQSLFRRRYRHPWLWASVAAALLIVMGVAPRLLAHTDEAAAQAAAPEAARPGGPTPDAAPANPAGHAGAAAGHAGPLHLTPNFAEFGTQLTPKVLMVILQLALVLALAKVMGWLFEMVKIPGVLGELAAGVLIGPYLLGQVLQVYVHGDWVPLFPPPMGLTDWPISDVLWTIAVIASVVLLFVTGLHTDLRQFLANLGPATICAIGGVVTPFFLGAWTVTLFTDHGFWHPASLFMGAIMVATSVGITARVLSDIRRLDTPEGVTILGAAVVDDVLGILVLAIVIGIVKAEAAGSAIDMASIAATAGKALGVWIGLTGITLLLAPRIEWLIQAVKYPGARVGLGLALAFLGAAVAEMFGLAFIIGAYSVGLGLSRTRMSHKMREELVGVNDFIVPLFFAAMGMLVNFNAMAGALAFGTVISVWAIVSKVFGCGVPALIWFRLKGAARVGVGMLPRGEVALIIAGVGLAERAISQEIFGVSILMTLVTTVIAPIGLVPLFRGKPGRRGVEEWPGKPMEAEVPVTVEMPETIAREFVRLLVAAFEERGFRASYSGEETGLYQLVRDGVVASIKTGEGRVVVETTPELEQESHELVHLAEERFLAAVRTIHEVPPGANKT